MTKAVFRQVSLLLMGLLMLLFVLDLTAQARPNTRRRSKPDESLIPEDQRPWAGKPWVVTGVLGAGALVVGFKNARRSHLD